MRRAVLLVVAACSTGQVAAPRAKSVREPASSTDDGEREARETHADRVAKRKKALEALVPAGSSCFPTAAKNAKKLRLELAALGDNARICAIDADRDSLLGVAGCWNVDLTGSKLAYIEPAPLPARGFARRLDGKCVDGFCLPDEPKGKTAQLAWSPDGKQVAMLADRKIHLFDAASQAHESAFSVEQSADSVTAIHHMGTHVIVQAKDGAWVYEPDGTQVGPITADKSETPLSTSTGGLALLDSTRVAIGEHGFEEMTIVDLASGTKTKVVRKPATKLKCKPAELEAFWTDEDSDSVGADCRASLTATLEPLVGATLIAGSKNFLALLRGDRAGQLAVIDSKTLVETRAISLPWCTGDEAPAKKPTSDDDDDE